MDKVDSVDRPDERPLRFSIPSDLIFRCGQSGQFGRCGQASLKTSKNFDSSDLILSCGQNGQCGRRGQASCETSKISMFVTFDLVVDKVDSVDGVDRPHDRPLIFLCLRHLI